MEAKPGFSGTEVASAQPQAPVPWNPLRAYPWWAVFLVVAGFALLYLILTDTNYRETFYFILPGVVVTLRITVLGYTLAVILGLLIGIGRTSKRPLIYNLSTLYVEVFRGIPMLVQILYMAYVVIPVLVRFGKSVGAWGQTWAAHLPLLGGLFAWMAQWNIQHFPLEVRAILALGIGYAAYEAEVFRAGIQSIGKGQWEAAYSLGMNYFQTLRLIVLPQAIRRVLPPLGNDLVAMLKDTSLVTVIAVREITQLARLRRAATFRPAEAFNILAYLYLSMTLSLSSLVRYIERKMRIPHQ